MLLQDFAQRPIRDATTVGKTPSGPAQRLRGGRAKAIPELADKARLADTCVAEDRHQLRFALIARLCIHMLEQAELLLAGNERAAKAADAPWAHKRQGTHDPPALDAFGLPLRLDRLRSAELEGATRKRDRALANHDLAGRRSLLEPGGDVDRIAGNEGASFARLVDDHLARVDADSQAKLIPEELAQPPLHRQTGMQRPFRVILERRWGAKDGHHGIPDELLDRPAGSLDLLGHRLVEDLEHAPRPLRVLRATELSRGNEVGEDDRRELPFTLAGSDLDRGRARRAEARCLRKSGAAGGAGGHPANCGGVRDSRQRPYTNTGGPPGPGVRN